MQLVSTEGAESAVVHTQGWPPSVATQVGNVSEMQGVQWTGSIPVPTGFGTPGALLITKTEPTKVGHLTLYISTVTASQEGGKDITFHCHSTIAVEQKERIFFPGTPQLPSQGTPDMLKLRQAELAILRGDGTPEGKMLVDTDRIYKYDTYRDLGQPWRNPSAERPTLGGAGLPFPRRLASYRPKWEKTDFESKVEDPNALLKVFVELPENCPYLPLDEQWNNTKERGFLGSAAGAILGGVKALVESRLRDFPNPKGFISLHAVDSMYQYSPLPQETKEDGNPLKFDDYFIASLRRSLQGQKDQVTTGSFNLRTALARIGDDIGTVGRFIRSRVLSWPSSSLVDLITTFPIPAVRGNRSLESFTDAEFGRQLVAGQHPCTIQAMTAQWLEGTPFTDAQVEDFLEGKSLSEHVQQGGRMFCVDYVAGFLDYMEEIDSQEMDTRFDNKRDAFLEKQRKLHAGRALLFYTNEGYLKPVAIQLISDPKDQKKDPKEQGEVYTPNDATELWTLAKAVFGNLDFLYHQVGSHYLVGHACQEPFIIAFMRHVSALHPVYKLMRPHFRNTLHVNAFGRVILTAAGTPIEALLTPGMYGMRLCSYIYKNVYSFKLANFESDLINRGMAARDAEGQRLKPVIDYPFAEDGLDIWYAMRDWFDAYLRLYYDDNGNGGKVAVMEDTEILAFWEEVKTKGHPDLAADAWPELKDIASLRDILTSIAFNGSVHHSAVNFGNYDYSAWCPNRPSMIRKAIPRKDEADKITRLKANFEEEFLSYLTEPQDAIQIAATFRILSTHAENEEYLTETEPEWIEDLSARTALKNFAQVMTDLDGKIDERNMNPKSKMRGNPGSKGAPYNLLRPKSTAGPTGRGIPYSTTI
ncbi:hypothetical protein CVIRNUC_010541 [Coccomyxa viridis]|uniref:Lipoxygenase n=1 Tax=Coccomyxa viridis TaxID=1274662 RepID=A0AAV1IJ11_9CHLO|nr:hypothetical protein CVIRNUC_010541 [Coccomyxa viridis]